MATEEFQQMLQKDFTIVGCETAIQSYRKFCPEWQFTSMIDSSMTDSKVQLYLAWNTIVFVLSH